MMKAIESRPIAFTNNLVFAHMIEHHSGHVNPIKHADNVLQGKAGGEMPKPDDTKANESESGCHCLLLAVAADIAHRRGSNH
jgi:hypothetical protein